MLKSPGKATLHLKFGKRVCVCLRNKMMGKRLRDAVRPTVFGWFSCWCEKPGAH